MKIPSVGKILSVRKNYSIWVKPKYKNTEKNHFSLSILKTTLLIRFV